MTSTSGYSLQEDPSVASKPNISFIGLDPSLEYWITEAKKRIFSIAAGNRVSLIATKIMELGLAKVLYAAHQLGADLESSNPFVFFTPDGTVSLNPVRTLRGFTYGGMFNMDFDGLIGTSNSIPNGCGFSIYEIEETGPDTGLISSLKDAQSRLGPDTLTQLGKGNHFAGLYDVLDPVTGEDTNRRFVIIHCSGHVGGHKLAHPDSWLSETDGYNEIKTPHGSVTLFEGEAKKLYLDQFSETEVANSDNRDETMKELLENSPYSWKVLEKITHQGLFDDGSNHIIGTQKHNGLMPIAFNPEEGVICVKTKPNLTSEFLDTWRDGERVKELGLEKKFQALDLTPHGAGYEFRFPIKSLKIQLGTEGISNFLLDLKAEDGRMSFTYFREIREWLTFRRRAPVMREVDRADLAEIIYEMPGLMQIYPLKSIPGGSHG